MMKTVGTAFALMLMAATSMDASAADIEQGETLAGQWCSSCHLIGTDQAAGGDSAPPFSVIAETAADRTDELEAWLADPHPPMPNLNLTIHEIDDLLAYIQSLGDR